MPVIKFIKQINCEYFITYLTCTGNKRNFRHWELDTGNSKRLGNPILCHDPVVKFISTTFQGNKKYFTLSWFSNQFPDTYFSAASAAKCAFSFRSLSVAVVCGDESFFFTSIMEVLLPVGSARSVAWREVVDLRDWLPPSSKSYQWSKERHALGNKAAKWKQKNLVCNKLQLRKEGSLLQVYCGNLSQSNDNATLDGWQHQN